MTTTRRPRGGCYAGPDGVIVHYVTTMEAAERGLKRARCPEHDGIHIGDMCDTADKTVRLATELREAIYTGRLADAYRYTDRIGLQLAVIRQELRPGEGTTR